MEYATYVGGPLDGQKTSRPTGRWAEYLDESGARIRRQKMQEHTNVLYRYTERWDTSTRPSVKIREYVHSTAAGEARRGLQDAA